MKWLLKLLGIRTYEPFRLPYSELKDGQCFWLNGECLVKENEDYVFAFERPERRRFPRNQIVELAEIERRHQYVL